MIEWFVLAGVLCVLLALVAALVGEVFGINGRLDAADEEEWDGPRVTSGKRTTDFPLEHTGSDHHWPDRIDQRRD